MSEPLEYEAPARPPSHASVILGVISIACIPTLCAAGGIDRIADEARWLIPICGSFIGLSGIAYRKSSSAVTAWFGMVLNLVVVVLLFALRHVIWLD